MRSYEDEAQCDIYLSPSPLLKHYLPLHHRDPFDRLLIAQAHQEGLILVTHDPQFSVYPVPLLW
jgi:PIN domain nuclease of toxin-antitoxin system